MIRIDRFGSAAEFLAVAEPHLLRAESENGVILGIAGMLASGAIPIKTPPYFCVVRDGEEIVFAAFMSLPGRLGVTRSSRADVGAALALDLADDERAVETVGGPEPTSGDVANALAALRGGKAKRVFAQRIFELKRVDHLGNAPGRMRLASEADAARLIPWTADFYREVGEKLDPGDGVRQRTAAEQLYVWDDPTIGAPVSMAAWTGKTKNGVRVAYVYTPPELRGRGYATANVAHLTKLLLERGNKFCCLYTDLANPTSNAIYARIGYRPVCDAGVFSFGE